LYTKRFHQLTVFVNKQFIFLFQYVCVRIDLV